MESVFEAVEKSVELRKSFLEVPLVIFGFELDVEKHCTLLGLVLREGRDRYFDSRGQVVVVH